MQTDGDRSCHVLLPGGINVDICTRSGANAFLQSENSNDRLSGDVELMMKIRSKRKFNSTDKSDIVKINCFLADIAEIASLDVFRKHVEERTIRAWLNCVTTQFRWLATSHFWITTGDLTDHDITLFYPCILMMHHAVPTALAFEGEFFSVLADCVKTRKGTGRALPSDYICYAISAIVSHAYHTSKVRFDNTWTTEKALKKLEATGILEQFIRCATVPESNEPYLIKMLDAFQGCIPFISKKLRPGQPCGDVIKAILEGKDGSRVEVPVVLSKLRTMMRFATSFDQESRIFDRKKMCQHCGKADDSEAFQKSLMKCARCQVAWYCSKECQKVDWKSHKTVCNPAAKKQMAKTENVYHALGFFLRTKYTNIMSKMVEAYAQTGLSNKDLLVEVDFTTNENGIVPAMHDEPEIKVAPAKDYHEGSRPAEPAWLEEFYDEKTCEEYRSNILPLIKQCHSSMTPKKIMVLVRSEVGFVVTAFEHPRLSEEAVIAFKAMLDGDDGPLTEILTKKCYGSSW